MHARTHARTDTQAAAQWPPNDLARTATAHPRCRPKNEGNRYGLHKGTSPFHTTPSCVSHVAPWPVAIFVSSTDAHCPLCSHQKAHSCSLPCACSHLMIECICISGLGERLGHVLSVAQVLLYLQNSFRTRLLDDSHKPQCVDESDLLAG